MIELILIAFLITIGVLLVWYKIVDIYFNRKQKFYGAFIGAFGNMLEEATKKINELGGKKNVE